MTIKTTLAAFILVLAPGLASAQCFGDYHQPKQTAMSCAEGMIIDEETGTCVPLSIS